MQILITHSAPVVVKKLYKLKCSVSFVELWLQLKLLVYLPQTYIIEIVTYKFSLSLHFCLPYPFVQSLLLYYYYYYPYYFLLFRFYYKTITFPDFLYYCWQCDGRAINQINSNWAINNVYAYYFLFDICEIYLRDLLDVVNTVLPSTVENMFQK